MNKIKVSIVVPVYNGGKHVEEFLDSIIVQSFSSFECIIVNDCSTDNTSIILEYYQKKDKRFHIINNPTSFGAGVSRNIGIKRACGEAVIIFDSDDIVHNRCLELCYTRLQETNADVCFIPCIKVIVNSGNVRPHYMPIEYSNNKKHILDKQMVVSNVFHFFPWAAWNRMYRRDYLIQNNFEFQSIKRYNDLYFGIMSIIFAKTLCYINTKTPLYQYISGRSGQMTTECTYDIDSYFSALKQIQIELPEVYMKKIEKSYNSAIMDFMSNFQGLWDDTEKTKAYELAQETIYVRGNMECGFLNKIDYHYYNHIITKKFKFYKKNIFTDEELLKKLFSQYLDYTICVWGLGKNGKEFIDAASQYKNCITAITDITIKTNTGFYHGIPLLSLKKALMDCEIVFYTSAYFGDSILYQIRNLHHEAIIVNLEAYFRLGIQIDSCQLYSTNRFLDDTI